MKTEVEIWVDLKAEKTETGVKRKSSESFFAIWMTKLANGRLQERKTSAEDKCIPGFKNIWREDLMHSKTGKSPAIHLRH